MKTVLRSLSFPLKTSVPCVFRDGRTIGSQAKCHYSTKRTTLFERLEMRLHRIASLKARCYWSTWTQPIHSPSTSCSESVIIYNFKWKLKKLKVFSCCGCEGKWGNSNNRIESNICCGRLHTPPQTTLSCNWIPPLCVVVWRSGSLLSFVVWLLSFDPSRLSTCVETCSAVEQLLFCVCRHPQFETPFPDFFPLL